MTREVDHDSKAEVITTNTCIRYLDIEYWMSKMIYWSYMKCGKILTRISKSQCQEQI